MNEDFTYEESQCQHCGRIRRGMTPSRCPSCGGHLKILKLETEETVIIKNGNHVFIPKESA